MKNKRNIILGMAGFIAIIAMIGFTITSCDFLEEMLHEHDYGTKWKINATQHWKECECGDKIDVGNHIGNLSAGGCSVCLHVHSYDTDSRVYDATQHWYECSCGAKSTAANHYTSGTWSTNAAQHWKECTACSAKFDVANHSGDPCTICAYDSVPGRALNGSWTQPIVEGHSYMEMKYNNGDYEYTLVGKDDDGEPTVLPDTKGTYIVNDGKITMTITHVYGGGLTGIFAFGLGFIFFFSDFESLEAEWYTKADIRARIDAATSSGLYGEDEGDPHEMAIEILDSLFTSQTQDYSISGNTLTLTSENEDGEVKTNKYTRKQ